MAKLTTEDLLTREGRIKFLAAVAADDGDTTGQYKGYTHEERIQALELLMSVEGDQAVAGSCGGGVNCDGYEPSDEEYCEGCEVCCGVDIEDDDELLDEPEDDIPSDEEVSKL
jgi:hypothetical protein